MLSLVVENLTTGYKGRLVSSVSFSLKEGEVMGLVGRSGAGKSTVLKTIVGLLKPLKGEVKVLRDGSVVKDYRRLIGYSPQENSLYPYLTVEENLYLFGKLYGLEKRFLEKQASFLLTELDLQSARRKLVSKLSGGMAKRADLAVALIHNPEVLVLDEPFTGLDVSLQYFLWRFLKNLATERNRIVIVSSHSLADLERQCDNLGLVERGVFYTYEQIIAALRKEEVTDLEDYLKRLFYKDLMEGVS